MSRPVGLCVFFQMTLCSPGVVTLIWRDYWDLGEEEFPVGKGHEAVLQADKIEN